MGEEEKYDVPSPTTADTVHTIARAGLCMIPVLGGPVAELFSMILTPPISKRRDKWMESVAEGLRWMEENMEGLKIEDLSENESFVTTLVQASQIAIRSHQAEKLEALRNVVLNSALPNPPDEDMQLVFLNLVDQFTTWHLRVLKFLDEPRQWCYRENIRLSKGRTALGLEGHFQELQEYPGFCKQIPLDLSSHGLVIELVTRQDVVIHPEQPILGKIRGIDSILTPMGRQFLAFITSPLKAK
ncbi:MAG TPA: hypothetical protein VMX94_00370 [Armatimonadota bacterium]|nr:hypothetical protein [Armatimonadota bacterium]